MSCDPSSKNCVVVRVHTPNQLLSYARVGYTKWTRVDTHEDCKHYVDVCYDSGDGLFYAFQGCGDVYTIDLHGPSALLNIVYKHKASYHTDSKYIVQAPWGDFFQIWRWDRYLEDGEEVVEDDDDKDADEGVEELEMMAAEIEMEEDEEEIESDVEEHVEVEVVSEDLETDTETEQDEEEVENADVSVEGEEDEVAENADVLVEEMDNADVPVEEKVDEERTMEEGEEKERVTARFVVYKIDFVKQKLTKVKDLKDHTLFSGFNTSFLVPAKDFPTLIPNSIHHTDDLNHNTFSKRFSDRRALIDKGLRQVFIFNMEDSSFTNILAPNSSRLNWPPPVWIQP